VSCGQISHKLDGDVERRCCLAMPLKCAKRAYGEATSPPLLMHEILYVFGSLEFASALHTLSTIPAMKFRYPFFLLFFAFFLNASAFSKDFEDNTYLGDVEWNTFPSKISQTNSVSKDYSH
jgi:hypothetical protein